MSVQEEYITVPVTEVKIGDVLLETHTVVGMGAANQRGKEALRLDLELNEEHSTGSTRSARLVLPTDHVLTVSRIMAYHGG